MQQRIEVRAAGAEALHYLSIDKLFASEVDLAGEPMADTAMAEGA
jgi:hypothetical protein